MGNKGLLTIIVVVLIGVATVLLIQASQEPGLVDNQTNENSNDGLRTSLEEN